METTTDLPDINAPHGTSEPEAPRLIQFVQEHRVAAITPALQPALEKAGALVMQILTSRVDVAGIDSQSEAVKAALEDFDGIRDRKTMESACALGLDAKWVQKEVKESALEDLKAAAFALHRLLSGLSGDLEGPAKEAEVKVKAAIELFSRSEAREHYLRELEAQAAANVRAKADREREVKALRGAGRDRDADALERMPITVPYLPKPYEAAPVKGVSVSVQSHRCVIVDPALLPDDLMKLVPDEDLIAARAAAGGFQTRIPGVEFEPVYRIALSPKRR